MANVLENDQALEAREVTTFYQGMRIIAPSLFVLGISLTGWWLTSAKAAEDRGKLEQRLITAESNIIELKKDVKYNQMELLALKIANAELKADVKNIKEDTEETLQLVRDWTSRYSR
jgi:hypothetical protein